MLWGADSASAGGVSGRISGEETRFSAANVSGMSNVMRTAEIKMAELNRNGNQRSFARSQDPIGAMMASQMMAPAPST